MREDHLVSCWDMSTNNPPDLGFRGLGNDGVSTGLVAATDIVQGIHGKSMATEFDGATEWINVPGIDDWPNGKSALSLCCWIKFTVNQSARGLIGWWYAADFRLRIGTNSVVDFRIGGGSAVSPLAYNDGSWHHVVGAFDISLAVDNVKLFIDGALIDTANWTTPIATIDPFAISNAGLDGSAGLKFAGVVDDVRIYDTALTNLQATDLYVASRQGRL